MVRYSCREAVAVITIDRPATRNALDPATAAGLREACLRFDADPSAHVAVLAGAGDTFCAGFDLKALAHGEEPDGEHGPMGPTWLRLGKPVVAAIEGYAVGGGLELALWCDLRVAAENAVLGVFNRRYGVPLVDLGTVRLPRLIGQSRALDLILTGRPVGAPEALATGLVNRVVPSGEALGAALVLAHELAGVPQSGLRSDRLSVLEQWGLSEDEARRNEWRRGLETLRGGEPVAGARRFAGRTRRPDSTD